MLEILKDFWPHITFFLASAISIYRWRVSELRHNDVLVWSNQCIEVMQSMYLRMQRSSDEAQDDCEEIDRLSFDASVLVEHGRLLFKNINTGNLKKYGKEKPAAYQGIRPRILDLVLSVHEAGCRWKASSKDERSFLVRAVEKAERDFVSLAQKEVGRARTSSKLTREPGKGRPLDQILEELKRLHEEKPSGSD